MRKHNRYRADRNRLLQQKGRAHQQARPFLVNEAVGNYMPMPPPMPPGMAGALSSSGSSEMSASVVSMRPAIEAAFWSAERVTLAGSMTPASTRSSKVSVAAL